MSSVSWREVKHCDNLTWVCELWSMAFDAEVQIKAELSERLTLVFWHSFRLWHLFVTIWIDLTEDLLAGADLRVDSRYKGFETWALVKLWFLYPINVVSCGFIHVFQSMQTFCHSVHTGSHYCVSWISWFCFFTAEHTPGCLSDTCNKFNFWSANWGYPNKLFTFALQVLSSLATNSPKPIQCVC